jgi:polyisoprenoid-binding protein YceI
MKHGIVLAGVLLMTIATATAQDKYFTKSGKVRFVSKGAIETIEAQHKSVTCVLDTKSGAVQFAVLMKGFEFRKALMQEHFNENYVESDKYPKAEFKGQVVNNSSVDYTREGAYNVQVKGQLTIHGQTKDMETTGKITVKGGKVQTATGFTILLSDYNISIPAVVKDNINNTVQITADCLLEPLKN